jgi:hypothetical protein
MSEALDQMFTDRSKVSRSMSSALISSSVVPSRSTPRSTAALQIEPGSWMIFTFGRAVAPHRDPARRRTISAPVHRRIVEPEIEARRFSASELAGVVEVRTTIGWVRASITPNGIEIWCPRGPRAALNSRSVDLVDQQDDGVLGADARAAAW